MSGVTPFDMPDAKKNDDPEVSSTDESFDVESVNHQIELEKDNEIQFRTCTWQKVSIIGSTTMCIILSYLRSRLPRCSSPSTFVWRSCPSRFLILCWEWFLVCL